MLSKYQSATMLRFGSSNEEHVMKTENTTANLVNTVMQQQQKLTQQLASGKRINSAADDAAGLQIANRLLRDVNSQSQGERNLVDGVAFARVYEQALQGVNENVQALAQLAVAAGNGAYSAADRVALQKEANGYLANIQQGLQTEFAGKPLLSADTDVVFSAGDSQLTIQTRDLRAVLANDNIFNVNLTDTATLTDSLTMLRRTSEQLSVMQAETGGRINQFERAGAVASAAKTASSEARSRLTDLDFAKASSAEVASSILAQTSINVALQARLSSAQALSLLSS